MPRWGSKCSKTNAEKSSPPKKSSQSGYRAPAPALHPPALSRACSPSSAPALTRACLLLSRAPARASSRARGVPCAVRPILRALLRCPSERIAAGSHDQGEPERPHEDASRRHRRFWCAKPFGPIPAACPLYTIRTNPLQAERLLAPSPHMRWPQRQRSRRRTSRLKRCSRRSRCARLLALPRSRLLSPPSSPPTPFPMSALV